MKLAVDTNSGVSDCFNANTLPRVGKKKRGNYEVQQKRLLYLGADTHLTVSLLQFVPVGAEMKDDPTIRIS